jgi:hypothetical protein
LRQAEIEEIEFFALRDAYLKENENVCDREKDFEL